MIIQHNIMALNAYRQLNGNNMALARNLEKLASGYRINRAGDDAAGLAISEKMRAQIKGLETAQKNAQDGISLIQTAEGALNEIHAMLNRMVELAGQASNGIYDDQVDRKALDDEFQALKGEIDRISKATNFNGKNLLDGTLALGAAGSTAGAANKISADLSGILKFGQATPVAAVRAEYVLPEDQVENFLKNALDIADPTNTTPAEILAAMGLSGKDYEVLLGDGAAFNAANIQTEGIMLRAKAAGVDPNAVKITTVGLGITNAAGSGFYESITGRDSYRELTLTVDPETAADTNLIGKSFTINGKTYQFTGQNDRNENDEFIKESGEKLANGNYAIHLPEAYTAGGPTGGSIGGVGVGGYIAQTTYAQSVAEEIVRAVNTVEYNVETATNTAGPTYDAYSAAGSTSSLLSQIPGYADTTAQADAATGSVPKGYGNDAAYALLAQIGKGIFAGTAATPGDKVDYSRLNIITFNVADKLWTSGTSGGTAGGGLNLQIGDTGDAYNIITVGVEDMGTKGLGINNLNIATYEAAVDAIGTVAKQGEPGTIKGAINMVSAQRAALGALQNRLEHSINNLGVTIENVTAAESRIRDTDMAREMMEYTKNNILVQAAQAMLAQANMVPQGVLQLLR